MSNTLASRMYNARHEKDVTLDTVATAVGVSVSHLHDIERGHQPKPKIETLTRLTAYYGLSLDDVLLSCGKIPQDVYFKIINNPELLTVIRNHQV